LIEQREKRKQRRQRNIILSIAAAVFISLTALTIYAFFHKSEAEHQKTLALEALAARERELLRAQGAELRAMIQRIGLLVSQGQSASDPQQIERLKSEREEIKARLISVTKDHQEKLTEIPLRHLYIRPCYHWHLIKE
jgi:flagellar basal body-associated protein FliL